MRVEEKEIRTRRLKNGKRKEREMITFQRGTRPRKVREMLKWMLRSG